MADDRAGSPAVASHQDVVVCVGDGAPGAAWPLPLTVGPAGPTGSAAADGASVVVVSAVVVSAVVDSGADAEPDPISPPGAG